MPATLIGFIFIPERKRLSIVLPNQSDRGGACVDAWFYHHDLAKILRVLRSDLQLHDESELSCKLPTHYIIMFCTQ